MYGKTVSKNDVPAIEIASERAFKVLREYQRSYLVLESKYKYNCIQ